MDSNKYYDSTIEAPPATMDEYYATDHYRLVVSSIRKKGFNFKILDVGCGEGLLGSLLAKDNEVHGVDIHEEKIKRCSLMGIKAKLINEDCLLPYEDETFDVITCCDVLEHLMDPFKMLKEIKRVLKKGGSTILVVPNMFDLITRMRFPFGGWTKINFGVNLGHIRFYSKKTFEKLVEGEGFHVFKSISAGFGGYVPKILGLLSYAIAIFCFFSTEKNLKVRKQKIYQDISMLLTNIFGFTALGRGLLVIADKK